MIDTKIFISIDFEITDNRIIDRLYLSVSWNALWDTHHYDSF